MAQRAGRARSAAGGSILALTVALVLQACGTSDATLGVGACFDDPDDSTVVTEIKPVACTEPHRREVVFVGDFSPATSTYPSDEDFFDFETDRCLSAFQEYTGIDFTFDEDYGMSSYKPTDEEWADGERRIICYAYRLDDAQMTRSIKKT